MSVTAGLKCAPERFPNGEKINAMAVPPGGAERGGNWLTRSFGAGYPDLDSVVEQLEKHRRPQG